MPIKVWGAPFVGTLMVIGGLWDHEPIVAVLGVVVAVYGVFRIAQYNSL